MAYSDLEIFLGVSLVSGSSTRLFNINERPMFGGNKTDGCRTVIKMDCIRIEVVQNTLG